MGSWGWKCSRLAGHGRKAGKLAEPAGPGGAWSGGARVGPGWRGRGGQVREAGRPSGDGTQSRKQWGLLQGLSQGLHRSDLTLAGEGARPRASPADSERVFHVQTSKRFVWAEACSRPERRNHRRVTVTPSPDEERGSERQAVCPRSHASTVYIRVPGWTRESDPRGQRVATGSAPS